MLYEYTRPPLYPKQTKAFFGAERYAITEGTTKSGKTVGGMAWLVEQALFGKAGQNWWWISPVYSQAKIPFRRIKRGLPATLFQANESELTLTLPNGGIIWFKGADKPDTLYGDDVHGAVMDEFTRAKEEAFHAVRSTLSATRGKLRLIGNVKGRKNWGYRLARRAEAGEPDMSYHKITAYDAIAAGVLDADEVRDAQRVLPEAVFKELYLAEASDDGSNPFGLDAIAAACGPMSDAPPLVWGWDLAKSTDWTVGTGLDAAGTVSRFERWQGPWEITTPKIKELTAGLPALVDSTGVGDPIVEALQKGGGATYEGYKFTQPSKQKLMEGLALVLQQRRLRGLNEQQRLELENFEFVYVRTGVRYLAPEGIHDDCVMSLALAVRKHPTLGAPLEGWGVFEHMRELVSEQAQAQG